MKFIQSIYTSPGHNLLLQNAIQGNVNSQYNLAIFYLDETENFIEAYAWAEAASYQNHPGAHRIKLKAQGKLSAKQILKAWTKARNYKLSFC